MSNYRDNYKVMLLEHDEDGDWINASTCIGYSICEYYRVSLHKQPCMNSSQTGNVWLMEILSGNEKRCLNMFRMNTTTFLNLCSDLQQFGLQASSRMSLVEKVGMFLYRLALGASSRNVEERFQHSGETVSRLFHEVMTAVLTFSIELIKPKDPTFADIPLEILNDKRYMPYFKDCIGAIDGTHVPAVVSATDLPRFVGRKGIPTQNIMAVCNFNLEFTFVLAGWEGTTHDARVFQHALVKRELNFPKPPPGKYYLVDSRYPQREGFLGPYRGTTYHLPDFRSRGRPKGYKEVFNRWHSSLRCCIERTFGVWKARWKILRVMPSFKFHTQRNIVVATMALHNYIRKSSSTDVAFHKFDSNPEFVPVDEYDNEDFQDTERLQSSSNKVNSLRDKIAKSLLDNRG